MNVDRPGADVFAVQHGQEAADVLRRDRAELAPAELAHDPRPALLLPARPGPGKHRSMPVERGGLCTLLELQVLHPELDRVLEARLAHSRCDLLLGFDLGDHPAHLEIGLSLVQKALLDTAPALSPAPFRICFQPGRPQPALALRFRRVSPLHFIEGLVLVGAHVQGADRLPIHLHRGLHSSFASSWDMSSEPAICLRSLDARGYHLGTNAAETRLIETYVPGPTDAKKCLFAGKR